jgi:hypothetical protein
LVFGSCPTNFKTSREPRMPFPSIHQ